MVWASASGARAWGDSELCAVDETGSTGGLSSTPAALEAEGPQPLCSPDESFVATVPVIAPAQAEPSHAPSGVAAAREALQRAETFAKAGQRENAVLELRVVERELPRVADRFALRRAALLLELGLPEQACEASAIAAESPNREVAISAQIGSVQCQLRAGERNAERALTALMKKYPRLPQRYTLELELGMARKRAGNLRAAAEVFRRLDLAVPASTLAARARAELEQLVADGVRSAPYSGKERVQRAEHLLHDGPLEQAAEELSALEADRSLGAELHAQVLALAARVARIQGRFDQGSGARGTPDPAQRELAEKRLKVLRGGRSIASLKNGPLRSVLELAIANDMKDVCDEALEAMRTRKKLDAPVRFESALRASGLASDDKVAALFEGLVDVPRYRLAARYYRARALERMGRTVEAEADYQRVVAGDRGQTPYYSIWADLRLGGLRSQNRESCLPEDTANAVAGAAAARPSVRAAGVAAASAPDSLAGVEGGAGRAPTVLGKAAPANGTRDAGNAPALSLVGAIFDDSPAALARRARPASTEPLAPRQAPPVAAPSRAPAPKLSEAAARRTRVLAMLVPIAEQHGEAYPWFWRAVDMVELERFADAADEINEAYLAFRDINGSLRLRSGLLSLLTNSAPPRRAVSIAIARARQKLDRETRLVLSDVANLLGDPGVGVRFGQGRFDERPRAYAELVERAARNHGLDPNLLFAVMRVESIYNKRIISNAGAIGLMQIMPVTGDRIARQLGVEDFDATDLLDPQLNLEFSAWYLASLLQRFDGRLPLAIASYNGGPHNVRYWVRNAPAHMPLDAFLERIPFNETHDYVRRVLSYYAQYRAQQNLPMTRLSVELPELRPDPIAF